MISIAREHFHRNGYSSDTEVHREMHKDSLSRRYSPWLKLLVGPIYERYGFVQIGDCGQPEATRATTTYGCLPSQSCWPSAAEWSALNQTLSGHLYETVMLASPCFPSSQDYNNATRANILENYTNRDFTEVIGTIQYTEWETCGEANCLPSVLAPQSPICALGRISAYFVDAQKAGDVTATLKFVTDHGIRLVVKNTRHDYLGRSSAPNTLALRTFDMKALEYYTEFTASNCSVGNRNNIGVMGAGVVAHDAVEYFLERGMDSTVGACPSVCPTGGFGQGGRHSIFGPSYSLMVVQGVEFDVVLASSEYKTINQYNDPDLF
jgi:hypothetical protein